MIRTVRVSCSSLTRCTSPKRESRRSTLESGNTGGTRKKTVKSKYGFGKFGPPESAEDTDPFKWIAYLRWQADLSVETVRTLAEAFRKKCPKAIILGPDEIATLCPNDWERMGRVIDVATGQILCAAGGARRFNAGYLVKFHRDLTSRPVYPYVQLTKYGRSPTVETVYDWFDQLLQAGGEGVFLGAVEWFDRSLNHPKYAAPRKWWARARYCGTNADATARPPPRRQDDGTPFRQFHADVPPGSGSNADGSNVRHAGARGRRRGSRLRTTFRSREILRSGMSSRSSVLPDAKYADPSLCDAALRFVRRGGTLVVTDPEAFSFLLDGSDPAGVSQGVVRRDAFGRGTAKHGCLEWGLDE